MKKLVVLMLALGALTPALAQQRRHPPREAVDACANLNPGDACKVTLRDRSIDGVCRAAPDGNGPTACIPDGPPPEAIDACSGRAAGDACTVKFGEHSADGICRNGPDGNGPLACAPPAGAPRQHP